MFLFLLKKIEIWRFFQKKNEKSLEKFNINIFLIIALKKIIIYYLCANFSSLCKSIRRLVFTAEEILNRM